MDARNMLGSAYSLQGIQDLKDMSICHGFARKSIHIINLLAQKWEISLEEMDYEDDKADQRSATDGVSPFYVDATEALPSLQWTQDSYSPNWIPPKPLFELFPNQGLPELEGVGVEDTVMGSSNKTDPRISAASHEVKLRRLGFEFATVRNTTTLNEGGFQQYGGDREGAQS
jgi:hypothetical protein